MTKEQLELMVLAQQGLAPARKHREAIKLERKRKRLMLDGGE
jgi:hypothetical protein